MTEEERDNSLEELFRRKLAENEMAAGSDLTARFMHRLDRREFIRFNPVRFNVWYLAIVLAGLTVAGIIIFTSPRTGGKTTLPGHEPSHTGIVVINKNEGIAEKHATIIDTSQVAEIKIASDADRVEASSDGVTERQTGIMTSMSGRTAIKVIQPENEAITISGRMLRARIEASVLSGCVPLHVSFVCPADETMNVRWNFGDGGTSSELNPSYVYDVPGTYKVSLVMTDGKGRASIATSLIEVFGVPKAAFEIRKDELKEEDGRTRFVNLSVGAVRYLWSFGDGTTSSAVDPEHEYRHPGNYDVKLISWSENGCADSVTLRDAFADKGMFIRFSNAFTPNNGGPTGGYYNTRTDEDNQIFHPVASGVADYNLKIYSKAGLLVFESDDLQMGWDGYYKGQKCSPGVYVWKVRGTYRNGQSFVMAGDVTLINY